MARRLVRFGVAATLVVVTVGGGSAPRPAWACQCVSMTDAELYQRAGVVFTGRADAARRGLFAGDVAWTFYVERVQKGAVPQGAVVRTGADSCAPAFRPARRYQVFAVMQGDDLRTDRCRGTRDLATATAYIGGRETAPGPAEPEGFRFPWTLAGDIGMGLVAAAALLLGPPLFRRRRRTQPPD